MSPFKHTMLAVGVALMLFAGSSAVLSPPEQATPMFVAREAEMVTRAVRLWMKKPVAGLKPAVAPAAHSVGCGVRVSDII